MFRHWIGTIAIGVFLAAIGVAPASSAQVTDNTADVDTGNVRIPADWNEAMKSTPDGDFRRLEMTPSAEKHSKLQVGPLEFEGRMLTGEAPWQPHEEPGNRGFLTINGPAQRSAGHLTFACITENGGYRQSVNGAGGESASAGQTVLTVPEKIR
jgi:hypothetical protein